MSYIKKYIILIESTRFTRLATEFCNDILQNYLTKAYVSINCLYTQISEIHLANITYSNILIGIF